MSVVVVVVEVVDAVVITEVVEVQVQVVFQEVIFL